MTDRIITEQSNGIGWLTLNNPHRHNAISLDMWQGLDEVLARFDADPGIPHRRDPQCWELRFCLGGGLLVAAGADIRVAADNVVFGIPAARLGLGDDFDGVTRLLNLMNPADVAEMLVTARRFDASHARTVGLVNRILPASQLEAEVHRMAEEIAANAPLTVRAVRPVLRQARIEPGARDIAWLNRMLAACFDSADYAEGRCAFREKRPPRFTGA